jgi:hypothetical protein
MRFHARMVINRKSFYHKPVDALVKASNYIPKSLLPEMPTWVTKITWRPHA